MLALLLLPSPVWAGRIEYEGPAGCPDAASFEAELTSRMEAASPGARLARAAGVVLRVSITEGERFVGALLIERAGVVLVRRSLSGTSCDEVVEALALLAALGLVDVPAPSPATPTGRPPEKRRSLSLGAEAGVYQGIAPGAAFGAEVFLEPSLRRRLRARPSIRLGVAAAGGGWSNLAGREGSFVWAVGHFSVCPVRFLIARVLDLGPCIRLELGALHAAGRFPGTTRSATGIWLAPSLLGRLSWRMVGGLRLEAEVGASFPVFGSRHYFPYEVPPAAAVGRLGLSWTF
jgi:hypothetical protein